MERENTIKYREWKSQIMIRSNLLDLLYNGEYSNDKSMAIHSLARRVHSFNGSAYVFQHRQYTPIQIAFD